MGNSASHDIAECLSGRGLIRSGTRALELFPVWASAFLTQVTRVSRLRDVFCWSTAFSTHFPFPLLHPTVGSETIN